METNETNPSEERPTVVKTPRPIFEYIVILIVFLVLVGMLLVIQGPRTGNYFGGGRGITNGLSGT